MFDEVCARTSHIIHAAAKVKSWELSRFHELAAENSASCVHVGEMASRCVDGNVYYVSTLSAKNPSLRDCSDSVTYVSDFRGAITSMKAYDLTK